MDNNKDDKTQTKNEFMMRMYDQMFSTIDRSYKNIWEMILAIGGGIGVLQLEGKTFFDIAVIGYIIGLFWILIRLIDTNYWCNRNLFFIHKIEEELLGEKTDSIFVGFRKKRRDLENKYKTSIQYQILFVIIILFLTIFFFCYLKAGKINNFSTENKLWFLFILVLCLMVVVIKIYVKRNRDFKKNTNSNYDKVLDILRKEKLPLLIPNLHGNSLFLLKLDGDNLKIVNSKGTPFVYSKEIYEKILHRFCCAPNFVKFKICYYCKNSGDCGGWRRPYNPDEKFAGYLPAVFRELYVRYGIKVACSVDPKNTDLMRYSCTDWSLYIPYPVLDFFNLSYEDFLTELKSYSFDSKKYSYKILNNDLTIFTGNSSYLISKDIFYNIKNDLKAVYEKVSSYEFLCLLWEDRIFKGDCYPNVLKNLLSSYLKENIKKHWREWRKQNNESCSDDRNCSVCVLS